jgi:hypothetical protein
MGIDTKCYYFEKMFLDHGLICHSLALKLLNNLVGLASTNSQTVYSASKTGRNR